MKLKQKIAEWLKIAHIKEDVDCDESFFIVLHSWSEKEPKNHFQFESMVGKKIRITIEEMD